MDFSLKEGLGTIVAVFCVAMVIYGLFRIGIFAKLFDIVDASSDSNEVEVTDPVSTADTWLISLIDSDMEG